jgi:hypothetical protein
LTRDAGSGLLAVAMSHAEDGPLVAFLGPSLPAAEALGIVPEVDLRAPVCQGDLTTVVERQRPRAVLIVDGEFSQSLSVWHKEILHALHLGIRVVGASSMCALRAAELDRFGMEGVGEIYAYYRDGWLTADADVALLHADAAEGYRPLSWPLVNVRATVEALQRREALAADDAAAVLTAAGKLHFRERTKGTLVRALRAEATPTARAEELAQLVADGYVDQKALDAAAGFELLARLDQIPQPRGEVPLHREGIGFQPLRWSDVAIPRSAGSLRRYQLVSDAALHHPDFEGLLERAANRHIVNVLAWEFGAKVSAAEVEEQRARILDRLGLTEESLPDWLVANDLDEARFTSLVKEEATVTRMRRWLLSTLLSERNRRLVIEQLQLEGEYASAADAAARRRALADCRPTPPYPTTEEQVRDLLVRQIAISGWRPRRDLATFSDDQGFDHLTTLMVALSDSAAAHDELQERRRRVARALGLDEDGGGWPQPRAPSPSMRAHALLEAHQVTQVLLTAVELGLPAALAGEPRSTSELGAITRTQVSRLDRLLRALEAAGIVTFADDRWTLTLEGEALVPARPGDEEALDIYAEHLRVAAFSAWAGLADVIRGADPPPYPADELSDRAVAAVSRALDFAGIVLRTVQLPKGAHVVDIGGGLGGIAQSLLERRPDLTLSLVELPATAARAAARLAQASSYPKITVIPYEGQARLEAPADCCLLTRVLATVADSAAVELLAFAARSLTDGGRVEIIDFEADGTPAAAFSDLLHLARSGGAVRSRDQWQELARLAGLRIVRRRSVEGPYVHLSLELEQEATAAQPDRAGLTTAP